MSATTTATFEADAPTLNTPLEDRTRFCTFWVSGRLHGVDILCVKEVNQEARFTPVFHTPEEVQGYVNIRGQIYLILDLRSILGLGKSELTETSRLLLFKPEVGEAFGVVVDKIGDVQEVDAADVEERRKSAQGPSDSGERRGAREDLITGVCRLENDLMVILNPKNLLSAVEERMAS